MTLLNDAYLRNYISEGDSEDAIISYGTRTQVSHVDDRRVISYGVSSYGYDARLAPEFKVFTDVDSVIVDPKNFTPNCFSNRSAQVQDDNCSSIIIPPHSFVLGRTLEYFRIPRDVLVVCLGKSTYARCGIIVNVTPLEPGWEGQVTIEISNTTPLPAVIYAYEGISQFIFLQNPPDKLCATSYADRRGKYQKQKGITLPTV